MSGRLEQLTLLVPSKDRPDFLGRLLRYYHRAGFPGCIQIADASCGEEARRAQVIVRTMSGHLNVRYANYPKLRHDECWKRINESIATPYVAFLGDDDFLIPSGLEQCLAFLETHPDYHAAHGAAGLFQLKVPGPYGEVAWVEPYGGLRPLEQDTAAGRLRELFHRYSVPLFCVHRAPVWQAIWQHSRADLEWEISTELMPGALSAVQGKIKRLPGLYLMRQVHPQKHYNADAFEWILGAAWQPSGLVLLERLTERLARQDHLPIPKAQAIVRQAWWWYVASDLMGEWQRRYTPNRPRRWREAAGTLPFLRASWHALQAWGRGFGELSLPALLQARSCYHRAFLPVYEAVTQGEDGNPEPPPPVTLNATESVQAHALTALEPRHEVSVP